ncbi:MAG TPA: lipopolysaccharide transport periplasmic protein LptA [Chromatiales bacterium]|nr:lipopolysaccharide transport periplasmic protein LptA [Thiotrichales bacterium]HIP69599.1 lipopolysaccharide transport periplasmic protein LptA [Chromatiales bacterium]
MYRKLSLIIVASLFCITAGNAFAVDRSQPIELEADQVELDDNKGTSTYIGNVRLKQGELSLQANRVIVFLKDSKIIRIQAEGTPAKFKDKLEDNRLVEAEATQMDYNVSNEEILLTGDGMLNQNGNILRNDRIHYNLATGTLKAGGKDAEQRVKVILQPAETSP